MTIKPPRLRTGDTIGLIAPCIGLKPDYIEKSAKELKKMGFQLKLSRHLFSESWGFSAAWRNGLPTFRTWWQIPR